MPAPTRTVVTGYPSTMGDDVQLNTTTLIRHAARTHGDREIVYRLPDGGWGRYTYADAYDQGNQQRYNATLSSRSSFCCKLVNI